MTQRIDVHSVNQQIHVTGLETSRGGGGVGFDGEHVLTGDPEYPPEELAVGQLLYDGVESPNSSTFVISPGIDVAEIFDLANSGVELENVTINDVVTALLAKVEELSAEIEELKGA